MAVEYGTVAIVPRGEWNAATQYEVANLVTKDGSSHIAHTRPPIGTPPTNAAYWQVSAQGGNKATTDTLGVVKPDGTTIEVDSDGTLSAKQATQTTHGIVRGGDIVKIHDNGVLTAREATQSNTGVVRGGHSVKVSEGTLYLDTSFQQATELANIIANEAVGTILGKVSKAIAVTMGLDQNALLKNMLSNIDVNSANKIPTSAYIHTLVERIGMGTELTAGANLTEGLNNLNRDLIKNRGVISVDFNNYTTPGIWSYDGNQSVSNNPGNVAGNLEVIVSATYVIQRITAYDREYTRRKSGTTWTQWASYATTLDLDDYKTYTALNSGWTSNGLCYLRKLRREVHIHIQAVSGSIEDNTILMVNVPAPLSSPFAYLFKDKTVNGYMQVNADNNLILRSVTSASICGDLFYIAK